jgi:hypothetical protein
LKNFSDKQVLSSNFFDEIISLSKIALPLNEYINSQSIK